MRSARAQDAYDNQLLDPMSREMTRNVGVEDAYAPVVVRYRQGPS